MFKKTIEKIIGNRTKWAIASVVLLLTIFVPEQVHAQEFFFDALIKMIEFIMLIIQSAGSLVMILGGWVLELTIQYTVLNVSDFLKNEMVQYGWKLMRDFANLAFIASLIYVAIRTIFGLEDVNTKKFLMGIVIAGILVNFSFFLTALIIDASNYISTAILNEIAQNVAEETSPNQNWSAAAINAVSANSLTVGYLNRFSMVNMFSNEATKQMFTGAVSNNTGASMDISAASNLALTFLGTFAMFCVGVVFLAISFMLLARFVILLYALVMSPLAFMGYAVPYLKAKVTDEWWKKVIQNNIFTPVFFLLTLFTLKFLSLAQFATYNDTSNMTLVLLRPFFMLALGITCIIYTLYYATSFGSMGAGFARKMAMSAIGGVGALTVGRGAMALDKAIGGTKLGNSVLGRGLRSKFIKPVADSKFGGEYNASGLNKLAREAKSARDEIDEVASIREDLKNGNTENVEMKLRKMTTGELIAMRSKLNTKEKAQLDSLLTSEQMKSLRKIGEDGKNEDFGMNELRGVEKNRSSNLPGVVGKDISDKLNRLRREKDTATNGGVRTRLAAEIKTQEAELDKLNAGAKAQLTRLDTQELVNALTGTEGTDVNEILKGVKVASVEEALKNSTKDQAKKIKEALVTVDDKGNVTGGTYVETIKSGGEGWKTDDITKVQSILGSDNFNKSVEKAVGAGNAGILKNMSPELISSLSISTLTKPEVIKSMNLDSTKKTIDKLRGEDLNLFIRNIPEGHVAKKYVDDLMRGAPKLPSKPSLADPTPTFNPKDKPTNKSGLKLARNSSPSPEATTMRGGVKDEGGILMPNSYGSESQRQEKEKARQALDSLKNGGNITIN